jgi:hypothetical protein
MPATVLPDDELLVDVLADVAAVEVDGDAAADEFELVLLLLLEPQPAIATNAASASAMSAPRRTAILFSLMRSVPS